MSIRQLLPFPKSPWWLWVVMVVVWSVACIGALPCNKRPGEVVLPLAAATIWTALWANHWRYQPIVSWRALATLVVESTLDLCKIALLVMVAVVVLLLIKPVGNCYGDRMAVSEMALHAMPMREEIAQRAESKHSLTGVGTDLTFGTSPKGLEGFVTSTGTIVLLTREVPALIAIEPRLVEGRVQWTCHGVPKASMPAMCR